MPLRYVSMVVLCLMSLMPAMVRAAEPEKPATEPVAAEISIASVSAIANLLKDLGAPVPPTLTAEGLDGAFPFLGGVDVDRPASFTILMRPDLPEQNRGYFSVPAKDPATYMAKMKEQGAKTTVEGQEVYPLGPVSIKFTKDRVLFGGNPVSLKASDDAAMIKQYADGKALAAMWGDIRELRKTHPEVLKAFVDDLRAKDDAKHAYLPTAESAGEKAGRDAVYNYFEKTMERLELGFSKGANDTFAARVLVGPAVPWVGSETPVAMPALPADCAGRLDLVMTAPSAEVWNAGLKALTEDVKKTSKVPPEDVRALLSNALVVHFAGEASSVGWTVKDGACVAYVVRQNSKEQDVEALVKKLADDLAKLTAQDADNDKDHLKVDGYTTAAGAKVIREILSDKGAPVAYIDFLPKGKRVYMTVSDSDKKFVEGMPLDQDVAGQQLKKGVYLQVDAAKMLNAIQQKDKTVALPPAITDLLAKIAAPITLKFEPAADGLHGELVVPMAIIRAAANILPKE